MMDEPVRVLVIDDDEDDYVMIRDMLQQVGGAPAAVDWAPSYEAGLDGFREAVHDVYLLDYRLGGRTGLDLFREVHGKKQRAPVILMSGHGNHVVDMAAMRDGFSDYIPKERIGPSLLEHSIRYAIMRKRTEAEQRLGAIVESSHDAVIRLDLDGTIKSCNAGAYRVFGLLSPNVIGQPLACIERADAQGVIAALLDRVREEEDVDRVDISVQKADGTAIDVSAQVSAIRGEHGAVEGFSVIAHDITERKRARERRDRFVAVASHELRTPMTTILGFAELLLTRDESAAVQHDWLRMIHDEGLRMKAIINDMLDVARINEGFEIRSEPTGILAILETVVADARGRAPDHAVLVDGDPSLPLVIGDPQKLTQVFSNLVDNAIKYSPNGGDVLVSAQLDPASRCVVVSVADQGLGISEEEQRNLFTTFHRVQRAETINIGGTGLGLYIVKGLTEMMNGKIWVEGVRDQGTTFYVALPAESVADESAQELRSA